MTGRTIGALCAGYAGLDLRILGNGVVPQQFSALVRILPHRAFGAVAA